MFNTAVTIIMAKEYRISPPLNSFAAKYNPAIDIIRCISSLDIIIKKEPYGSFFKNPDATDAIVDTYPLLRHERHYERQNLIL